MATRVDRTNRIVLALLGTASARGRRPRPCPEPQLDRGGRPGHGQRPASRCRGGSGHPNGGSGPWSGRSHSSSPSCAHGGWSPRPAGSDCATWRSTRAAPAATPGSARAPIADAVEQEVEGYPGVADAQDAAAGNSGAAPAPARGVAHRPRGHRLGAREVDQPTPSPTFRTPWTSTTRTWRSEPFLAPGSAQHLDHAERAHGLLLPNGPSGGPHLTAQLARLLTGA